MADDQIRISLTDFMEFSMKEGAPRLTKVAEIMSRPKYDPATDYWRQLRDKICELHETGSFDIKELKRFAETISNSKKVGNYVSAVRGYSRFLGKKTVSWFVPPKGLWSSGGLQVRINPEIGLAYGEHRLVIKLYFKAEKLTSNRSRMLTFLLRRQLHLAEPRASFAVLDMPNGKIHLATQAKEDLTPLLFGEAAAFVAMWRSLAESRADAA